MRYRRLFQTAKDGILILDAITGKTIDANAFMSALVGVEPQDLMGKELYEIGMFADVEANKAAFRKLQGQKYLRREHLPVENRRGERVGVEFIVNVHHADHRIVAQCIVRDISQRVVMEKQIEPQVANLTKLVGDLLNVSRVVSGRIRLDLCVVDLNQVVRHAAETARRLIDQRRHTLTMDLSEDGPDGDRVWDSPWPTG
jgi:PAS domain S-box-containing protein